MSNMPLDAAIAGAFNENEPPRILHVRVINRNDFPISDMYDSVPYTFGPNIPVSIPVDAAAHIFGWWEGCDPAAMKKHCQRRFGWNTPEMQKAGQHDEFYKKLEVKPMLYRLVPMQVAEELGEPDLLAAAEAKEPKAKKSA